MSTHDLIVQSRVLWQPQDLIEARRIWADGSVYSRWCPAAELSTLIDPLTSENVAGANVYIGLNPRKERDKRGDANTLHARCLFADFDQTTIEQALFTLNAVGMPPATLTNWSGHGVHCFWLLSATLAPRFWREWQQDLAALLGSDPSVHNPERVMRAAGFLNMKREPTPCYVVECDPSRVYDLADLPIGMRAGSDTVPPIFRMRTIIDTDSGDPVARCRAYLSKCPDAVAKQQGHRTTWQAANTCNRFGLTEADALDLMRWYSETKCSPPWSEREIAHKVRDAYGRNAHEHGQKLREAKREPLFSIRNVRGAA